MSVLNDRRVSRARRPARGHQRPAFTAPAGPARPAGHRPPPAPDAMRAVLSNYARALPRVLNVLDVDAEFDEDDLNVSGMAGRADIGAAVGARAAASAGWPQRKRKRKGTDPARVVCFANQSGGSGKTTSATALGYLLSERGYRVLLIDLDPQHDACHIFGYTYPDQICGICLDSFAVNEQVTRRGIERIPVGECATGHKPEPHPNMFDVLINGNFGIKEAIRPALVQADQPIPGLDVALASTDLSAADKNFAQIVGAEVQLNSALDEVRHEYDYILIDSPASLGTLMVNILVASDFVIACVRAEQKELRAVEELLRTIGTVNLHLRKSSPLELGGVLVAGLPSKRDGVIYQEWAAQVGVMYPGKDLPNVPRTAKVTQSYTNRVVLPVWAPRHAASRAYNDIIDALLKRRVF